MIFEIVAVVFVVLLVGMVVLVPMLIFKSKEQKTFEQINPIQPQQITRADQVRLQTGHSVNIGVIDGNKSHQEYVLPEASRYMNVLNIGPIGSGKTRYMLSTFVKKDIADRNNAVVIYDPQRDLTTEIVSLCKAHNRVFKIFPDVGFNPLAGYGTAKTRAVLFANLYSQVSRSGKEGGGIYFSELVQTFIQVVVPLFEVTYKQPMTLQELKLLVENEAFRLRLLHDAPPGLEKLDFISAFGDGTAHSKWKQKDFEEKLTGLTIFIRRITSDEWLEHLLNRRNAPTLQKCIDNKDVIIIRAGGYPNTIGASLGLLFQVSLQEYIEHRDEAGRPMHFMSLYMDELPMYLNDNFQTLVSTSRKQQVSLFLGFQSIKQLYPYEDVITGQVRTWCVHSSLGYEECEYISKTIGETQAMAFSTSTPYDVRQGAGNWSTSPTFMRKLPPEDIRRIPQEKLLLLTTNPLKPRESDEHRFIIKPSLDSLNQIIASNPYKYNKPVLPPYPDKHIWA